MTVFQEVVKKSQQRMEDELPSLIGKSFKYHDKVLTSRGVDDAKT